MNDLEKRIEDERALLQKELALEKPIFDNFAAEGRIGKIRLGSNKKVYWKAFIFNDLKANMKFYCSKEDIKSHKSFLRIENCHHETYPRIFKLSFLYKLPSEHLDEKNILSNIITKTNIVVIDNLKKKYIHQKFCSSLIYKAMAGVNSYVIIRNFLVDHRMYSNLLTS